MITVREAMDTEGLKDATVLCGAGGLDRQMFGVTIMDIPDIANWLSGGELVISGILLPKHFSHAMIDDFLEKNVAGIVTKEKFTTSIDPELLTYCDQLNFPIILSNPSLNWGQIMSPITTYIVRKPYLLIEESQRFHNALMKSLIKGAGLSEMCGLMHEMAGETLSVMDNDLHLLGMSQNFDWKSYTREISGGKIQYADIRFHFPDENSVYVYQYQNLLLRSIGSKILLYPVTLNRIKYGYIALLVPMDTKELSPFRTVKIQQLALFVALNSTRKSEISNALRRFNGLIMDQLLASKNLNQRQIEDLLAPLGKKIHRKYYAVQLVYDELSTLDSFLLRNNRISQFHVQMEKGIPIFDHLLLFEKNNAQIILIPDPCDDLDDLVFRIREYFISSTSIQNVYIGISDAVHLCNIETAFRQSSYAANYLLSTKNRKICFYYKDLGILKFFMDSWGSLDETFLRHTYDQYISPLKAYDREHNTSLLDTLELYLHNNCSKTETEKQLFIHKNTLRARLETIGKILNCDLSKTEDLFNIQLAIKIKFFID